MKTENDPTPARWLTWEQQQAILEDLYARLRGREPVAVTRSCDHRLPVHPGLARTRRRRGP